MATVLLKVSSVNTTIQRNSKEKFNRDI